MENIKERFSDFNIPNYFSRVDNIHILELHIGLDEKSRKSIELRAEFAPRKITGTSAIEVNQYTKESYNTIRFSLDDDEISGLFYMFCDDLIEQSRMLKEKEKGYNTITNRFYQWKRLFVGPKKNYITEEKIIGLIGEIMFMREELAEHIGLSEALRSWSGQELTHKDFSYKDKWYEVKSIMRSGQTIKISSLEQLDSSVDGELIVFAFEKMSPAYNGITLNKLILDTQLLFETIAEREDFIEKVSLQGYEYSDYYDDFVYETGKCTKYNVNKDFPKITRRNIHDAIRKVAYDISLNDISAFKIE